MSTPEDTAPHLFLVRIWTDPAASPPGFTRGLIEDTRTRERRYFKSLDEMQTFVNLALVDARRGSDGPAD